MKKLTWATVFAGLILEWTVLTAQSTRPKVIAEFTGSSLKWIHAAEPEFERKKLDLDKYTVSVVEQNDSVPSSRTGLLPSSPLRTVHESFPSHSSSPSNASFGETRFRDRNALVVNPVMALRMK